MGIFGDLHGHEDVAETVFEQMNERGVTHIIGMGDFIGSGGPRSLDAILSKITPITGVEKGKIFLSPGNWEHETGTPPKVMNRIMKKYGNLVYELYDGHGFVEIGGEKIMVSHYPQHSIPEGFLPPPEYRKNAQAFVMETIRRGVHPPQDVIFGVFAHTHKGGSFIDEHTGKLVINPGVLHDRAKVDKEPRAFAVYYNQEKKIEFINFEENKVLTSVSVPEVDLLSGSFCGTVLLNSI